MGPRACRSIPQNSQLHRLFFNETTQHIDLILSSKQCQLGREQSRNVVAELDTGNLILPMLDLLSLLGLSQPTIPTANKQYHGAVCSFATS